MQEDQKENEVTEEFIKALPRSSKRAQFMKLAFAAMVILALAVLITAIWPQKVFAPHQVATQSVSSQVAARITVDEGGFTPATVQVAVGSDVVWTNTDSKAHEVAANPYPSKSSLPGLDSGQLTADQSYHFTFRKPGTYNYHDQLNPLLNGIIVVH